MMIARWTMLLVAVAAVLGLCRHETLAQDDTPTLRIAYSPNDEPSLDPHTTRDGVAFRMIGAVYEPLYTYAPGAEVKVIPCLAKDFPQFSEDGLTATIKLNTEARYHPSACFGKERSRNVEAADFIHSIKRLAQHSNISMYWMIAGLVVGLDDYSAATRNALEWETSSTEVAGLSAPDDATLVIKLTRPYGPLASMLAHPCFSVLPREAMDHYANLKIRAVGTGPYRLNAVAADRLYVLKRWDDYRGDKPAWPRVSFTRRLYWTEFEDEFANGTLHEIPTWPAYFAQVIKDGKPIGNLKGTPTAAHERPEQGYYFLSFNMDDPIWGAQDADGRALRRATNLCLDRALVLANAEWDSRWAEPQPDLFPYGQEFEASDDKLEYGRHDDVLAKSTLDGCKYKGGLNPATGKALSLSFAYPFQRRPGPARPDLYSGIAEALRDGLKKLGIELTVIRVEPTNYRDEVASGDTQMFVSGWFLDYPDPVNFLQLFWSANAATTLEFNNTARHRSAEFDKLFTAYEKLGPGDKQRAELTAAMAAQVAKDQPTIPVVRRRLASLRNTSIDWGQVPSQTYNDIRHTKAR